MDWTAQAAVRETRYRLDDTKATSLVTWAGYSGSVLYADTNKLAHKGGFKQHQRFVGTEERETKVQAKVKNTYRKPV